MSFSHFVSASVLACVIAACGSPPAPRELLDARREYERAGAGPASKLTPAQLHEAKLALDAAEATAAEDAESPRTRNLSYVAQRKTKIANAEGNIAAADKDLEQAKKDLLQLQTQGLQNAQNELSKT